MKAASREKASTDHREGPRHRVRLPGFVAEEDVGLGDVIKLAASYVGVQPCGGCARRAAALNRWMVFTAQGQSS
jgi:hypothetical protein